ncbi:MAG TPA: hypothetical protein VK210_02160, partial [Terriglobia bacterium]|nr:hypothetical protein [Terriglobia bacterium]
MRFRYGSSSTRAIAVARFQPYFFPENQATGLAPAVAAPVATSLEVHCVLNAPAAEIRIACLVRALE